MVFNVTEHPTADLAILFVDVPFPVNGSLVDFPDSGRKPSNSSVASLDTMSGMQEVPLFPDDPCLNTRDTTPQDKLFIVSKCDTVPGSPLFHHQNSNGTVLMALVSSIPSNCHTTPCRIHLTDISRHREWLATELRDQEPAPSIKLPKIPATVVFSFLKLLAVVSSLGGISFAFCCVMFLISN
nr:uncharacterized protein LOC115268715 [Aedes albopictus]